MRFFLDFVKRKIYILKKENFFSKSINQLIGLESREFANDLGDQGSIPGQVIPKTEKYGT